MSGTTRLASIAVVGLVIGCARGAWADTTYSPLDTRDFLSSPTSTKSLSDTDGKSPQTYVMMQNDFNNALSKGAPKIKTKVAKTPPKHDKPIKQHTEEHKGSSEETKTAHLPKMHVPEFHLPGLHKHKDDADKPAVASKDKGFDLKPKKDEGSKLSFDDPKNQIRDKEDKGSFFKSLSHGMASAGSMMKPSFHHSDKDPNHVQTAGNVRTTFGQVSNETSWDKHTANNSQPNVMSKNAPNKVASSSPEHRSMFNKAIGHFPFIGGGGPKNHPDVMANPKLAGKQPKQAKAPAF